MTRLLGTGLYAASLKRRLHAAQWLAAPVQQSSQFSNDEFESLTAQVALLTAKLESCRAAGREAIEDRNAALAQLARARSSSGAGPGSSHGVVPPDDAGKFAEAKRAFARLYHPDKVQAGGIEKVLRGEIFKEYWGKLEEIERQAKGRH